MSKFWLAFRAWIKDWRSGYDAEDLKRALSKLHKDPARVVHLTHRELAALKASWAEQQHGA